MIKLLLFFLVAVFLNFSKCALQGPPSGGLPDTSPPQVIDRSPVPELVGVDPSEVISCTFSERVDIRTAESAFFVSPRPQKPIQFNWNGNQVFLHWTERLDLETTYVITLRTSVKDLRNNPMESPIQWAFSTGKKLDRGTIAGKIIDSELSKENEIWAYRITMPDTISPLTSYPQFRTNNEKDGFFNLSYLKKTKYRIFGVLDRNRNGLYDIGIDDIGIPSKDIQITEKGKAPFIWLRLSKEDTTAPRLRRVIPQDNDHLSLVFSKAIDELGLPSVNSFLVTTGIETLNIKDIACLSKSNNTIELFTDTLTPYTLYYIKITGIKDRAGNLLNSRYDTASFRGITLKDTISPKIITFEPSPDSTKKIPPYQSLFLEFSEIMNRTSVEKGFIISESGVDSIPLLFQWADGARVLIKPINGFHQGKNYQIIIKSKEIQDVSSNCLTDSVFFHKLLVLDSIQTGSLSGKIESDSAEITSPLIVVLKNINQGKEISRRVLSKPGLFTFSNVPPGSYILECFEDKDGNGKYFYGSIKPYRPSENYMHYEKPIDIRAGWDTEEILLRFP